MKRNILDAGVPNLITTALITNTEYLAKVAETFDYRMFDAPQLKIIAEWCIEYYLKHHEAPKKSIESIFYTWAETQDEDAVDKKAISILLGDLSTDNDNDKADDDKDEIPLSYLLEQTTELLIKYQVEKLKEALEESIFQGDTGAAMEAVSDFQSTQNVSVIADRWKFYTTEEMPCDQHIDWLWKGYVAKGYVTLLNAMWKVGKTTLLESLFRQLDTGGEIGTEIVGGNRILVISEEPMGLWKRRELPNHVEIMCDPFLGKAPSMAIWQQLLNVINDRVKNEGFDLVVFDTIQNLWPLDDENDNAAATRAISPTRTFCESGAGVLITGHVNKTSGSTGSLLTCGRGAGSVAAWVDVLMLLQTFQNKGIEDPRRTITAGGRHLDMMKSVVIEYDLSAKTYKTIGSKLDAKHKDRREILLDLLPNEPPGYTVDEILATKWVDADSGIPVPGKSTIKEDLKKEVHAGRVTFLHGKGKDKKFRFVAVSPQDSMY